MSIEEIKLKLKEIEKIAESGDYEVAHAKEDELFLKFIEYVGTLPHKELSHKAKLVLYSSTLEFERHCA